MLSDVQGWVNERTGWDIWFINTTLAISVIAISVMVAGAVIQPVILIGLGGITLFVAVSYLINYLPAWYRVKLESKERNWTNWREAATKEWNESFLTKATILFTVAYLIFLFIASTTFVANAIASSL